MNFDPVVYHPFVRHEHTYLRVNFTNLVGTGTKRKYACAHTWRKRRHSVSPTILHPTLQVHNYTKLPTCMLYASGSQRWKYCSPPKINSKNLAAHLTHLKNFRSLLDL